MRQRPLVLVVDDDPGLRSSLERLLEANGYDVRTAAAGAEALELAPAADPDLILLDLLLPQEDGGVVLSRLRERCPATPVIMVTGVTETASVVSCLRAGAFDYIVKPYQVEELLKRVSNAVRQKSLEEDFHAVTSRLRLSQSHYQYLVQSSPDMIYTLDSQGRFTFVSRAAEHILGYWPSELLGQHYTEIVHPEDRPVAENSFNERRSARRQGSTSEIRLLRSAQSRSRDDRTVYTEIKAKGVWGDGVAETTGDACGVFQGTYGVARDNTRRRVAEKELRRQQAFFRQLFDNSPEAIAIIDVRETVRSVNRSFQSLFQYTPEECEGRNLNDLIVPPGLSQEAAGYTRSVFDTGLLQAETVRRRRDGTEVPVSVSAYPIELEGDQPGMYAAYADISEKKEAENTVRETLAKLRGAMGAVIHVMVSTVEARDPYTAGHQQRVSNLARAIGRKMGLPAEMIDGIRLAGAIHDLGKIKIPAEILSNPAPITEAERALIRIHPKVAYDILKTIDFDWPVAEVVYQHHERMDGSGYPRGLKGAEVCPEARVLIVADVVEAIASHRPYRPALGVEMALGEILDGRGSCYDPDVVDACVELFRKDAFRFHAE